MTDLESWIVRQSKRVPEPEKAERLLFWACVVMWAIVGTELMGVLR